MKDDGSRLKEGSLAMAQIKLLRFDIMIILAALLHTAVIPASTYAFDEPDAQLNNYTEGSDLVIEGELGEGEDDPADPPNYHDPADDIPPLTNEAELDPASVPYKQAVPCKQVLLGKAANSPIVSDDATVDDCPLPDDPEGGPNQDPGRAPTTRDLLYLATAVVRADGAGLYKRPLGVSYTNKYIPSIVAVTRPSQTHTVTMFGREIAVTFTATSYEWNWGDGTPNLVTTSTGSVWQDGMDLNTDPNLIRHYYTPPQGWRSMLDGPYPHEDREITLTTTWSGTLTNPFTGDTQTINGLITTTETTGKFPLSHLVINNTDTWEEKQGH